MAVNHSSMYVLCFYFQQPPKKTSKREKPKQKATPKSKKSVKSANVKKADSSTTKKNQNSSKKGMLEMTHFSATLKIQLICYSMVFKHIWKIGKLWRTLKGVYQFCVVYNFSKLTKISVCVL